MKNLLSDLESQVADTSQFKGHQYYCGQSEKEIEAYQLRRAVAEERAKGEKWRMRKE